MKECNCACLTFDILEEENIDFLIEEGDSIDFDISDSGGMLPRYKGDYEVEPRKVEQVLETKNKSMSDNVTVHKIFYTETSNIGGGMTCYIGME